MENNNHKILALKYRPQTFTELIGQDVIRDTIINAIKSNKIPNAYLLTGIRGIGKTTLKKLSSLARMNNTSMFAAVEIFVREDSSKIKLEMSSFLSKIYKWHKLKKETTEVNLIK